MSYLEVPRIHFAGQFMATPSTINNSTVNYNTAIVPPGSPGWNPDGMHFFLLTTCAVTATVDQAGTLATSSAGDSAVGASVGTDGTPKLVDIDPDFQSYSQIFGLRITVTAGTTEQVSGMMRATALRNLWFGRAAGGGMPGAGGIYHSFLNDVRWASTLTSPVLMRLKKVSPTVLSVKLSLYGYDPGTKMGRIVGTIGRSALPDDEMFLTRRSMGTPQSSAFGVAPWRPNVALNRVTIDLGHALPEVSAGGARVNQGNLSAVIIDDAVSPPTTTVVGSPIPYDAARLQVTAGVEDVTLSAAEMASLGTKRLGLVGSSPSQRLLIAERPSGLYMNAQTTFFRLSPGDSAKAIIRVSQFGGPKSGHSVALAFASPRAPATALTFSATATTSGGDAQFTLVASDPGAPRPSIDGQCYQLNFGDAPLTPSTVWGTIVVLVFSAFTAPAQPRWPDVEPIFRMFAHLYPGMKGIMDLGSHAVVSTPANITRLTHVMSLPEASPAYMPVTRDLSPAKRGMILAWLAAGAPA